MDLFFGYSADELLKMTGIEEADYKEYSKAYSDVKLQLFKNEVRKYLVRQMEEGKYDDDRFIGQFIKVNRSSKGKLLWITLNPKPETTLEVFRKFINSLLCTKLFSTKVVYSYEQRGVSVPTMGKGMHCHLLLDRDSGIKPSAYARRIFTKGKFLFGSIKHVNVKMYPMSYWDDKILYIQGTKWDEDKTEKISQDKVWRLANGLVSYYVSSPCDGELNDKAEV